MNPVPQSYLKFWEAERKYTENKKAGNKRKAAYWNRRAQSLLKTILAGK